jgi:hypothetical protein
MEDTVIEQLLESLEQKLDAMEEAGLGLRETELSAVQKVRLKLVEQYGSDFDRIRKVTEFVMTGSGDNSPNPPPPPPNITKIIAAVRSKQREQSREE